MTKSGSQPTPYRPRKPQATAFYQCVEDHFETLEQVYDERFARQYGVFRPYVRNVIHRFLDCGVLQKGVPWVRCDTCDHEYLLALGSSHAFLSKYVMRGGPESPVLQGNSQNQA